MKRMGIYLTDIQVKKLRAIQAKIGKKSGLFISDLIRTAINEWIERFEKKGRGRK